MFKKISILIGVGVLVVFFIDAGTTTSVSAGSESQPEPPAHQQWGDVQYHKLLSVGAFGERGRRQGSAGGARFSATTLSVQALTGEAPLVVRSADGRVGLAVRSNGDVHIDRNLVVYGQKRFAHPHPTDPNKLISYVAVEGPEAGTYIRGTGQIVNGEALIQLPEHFSLTTSAEGLTVTLSPLGEWLQLYVLEKSTTRIVVKEAEGKTGRFDYLVHGVRKGHEDFQVISEVDCSTLK